MRSSPSFSCSLCATVRLLQGESIASLKTVFCCSRELFFMTGFSSVSRKQWLCSFAFLHFKYSQCPRHLQPSGTTKAGSSRFCENLWSFISLRSVCAWKVRGGRALAPQWLSHGCSVFLYCGVCVCEGERERYSLVVLFMPVVVVQCYIIELTQNDKVCGSLALSPSPCVAAVCGFNYALWEVEDRSLFRN